MRQAFARRQTWRRSSHEGRRSCRVYRCLACKKSYATSRMLFCIALRVDRRQLSGLCGAEHGRLPRIPCRRSARSTASICCAMISSMTHAVPDRASISTDPKRSWKLSSSVSRRHHFTVLAVDILAAEKLQAETGREGSRRCRRPGFLNFAFGPNGLVQRGLTPRCRRTAGRRRTPGERFEIWIAARGSDRNGAPPCNAYRRLSFTVLRMPARFFERGQISNLVLAPLRQTFAQRMAVLHRKGRSACPLRSHSGASDATQFAFQPEAVAPRQGYRPRFGVVTLVKGGIPVAAHMSTLRASSSGP